LEDLTKIFFFGFHQQMYMISHQTISKKLIATLFLELIERAMEKLNKGQVKERMLISSEGLDVLKAEKKGIAKGIELEKHSPEELVWAPKSMSLCRIVFWAHSVE
jgi:hypothetical protein